MARHSHHPPPRVPTPRNSSHLYESPDNPLNLLDTLTRSRVAHIPRLVTSRNSPQAHYQLPFTSAEFKFRSTSIPSPSAPVHSSSSAPSFAKSRYASTSRTKHPPKSPASTIPENLYMEATTGVHSTRRGQRGKIKFRSSQTRRAQKNQS